MCGQHVANINATIAGLPTVTSALRSKMKSASCSRGASVLGGNVINSHEDSMLKVAHNFMSLSTILSAQRPANPPPSFCSPYDKPYQSFSSSCIPSSGSCSVGCQAKEFINVIPHFTRDMYDMAYDLEVYKKETSSLDCTMCPNTNSVQNVVSTWQNLGNSVSGSINVGSSGTLIAYINAGLGSNLADAMSQTSAFMTSGTDCSQCLVNKLQQNKVKKYKKCSNYVRNRSSGSGESSYSCQQKCYNTVKRSRHVHKRCHGHGRKQAFMKNKNIFRQFNDNVCSTFTLFNQAMTNLYTSANKIISTSIRNNLLNFKSTLNSLNETFGVILNNISNYANTTMADKHGELMTILTNSSEFVTNQTSDFLQQIGDIELYPSCQEFGNMTLDLQTDFNSDLMTCHEEADNILDRVALNTTLYLAFLGDRFNEFSTNCDTCVQNYCGSFACLSMIFIPITTISNCIASVNSAANAFKPIAYVHGNYTYNGIKENCTIAVRTAQNCSEMKVQAAQAALQALRANYASCKLSYTTTTTTPSE